MKLSFVMQSFLGDYPGARSNPIEKFNRAVNSFKEQIDSNWELIIVSDGCKITEEQYNLNHSNDSRILFKYIEPSEKRMYDNNDGIKFYRGYPRQVGVDMATGDWIGYCDSDDFIIRTAVLSIKKQLKIADQLSESRDDDSKIKMVFNTRIIENFVYLGIIKLQQQKFKGLPQEKMVPIVYGDLFEIRGLPSEWIEVSGNSMGTVFMWHKKGFPDHKWEDVYHKDQSEDILFADRVIKNYPKNIGTILVPYYVRCHYSKLWDH